ncbi:dephospho-CoA kinase [Motiliproteus sp. MSK22-1]|uniref:dephospho-CoA kinase n=1 Tax=Motiliproteus sp. MSK22-1 TaxID=1897630 RepID=UPI0009784679|nr:dephospho-CoA kinase [Motiliproteus sp. MSK22-1]OMH38138.1 dephospho-CoA kinase [Motiliproteus sp. MSK22-1]
MFTVGLTGGIGSGKSTVAELFAARDIKVVDTDIVAREVVEIGTPALQIIAEHFGTEILLTNGALNRAKLRHRVFQQPEQRVWLEKLLHPLIRQLTIQQLESAESDYVILVSPLLLETDQHQLTDHILVVDVPEAIQIERTLARDNNSEDQVRAILNAQCSRDDRLSKADSIINNTGPAEQLSKTVLSLDNKFRNMAHNNE